MKHIHLLSGAVSRRSVLKSAAGVLLAGGAVLASALPAAAQDMPFAGQRLSVLMVGHPTSDAIQKMLPDFTEATGIEVELEIIPESDATPKMLLEFSAGSGRYDVVENNTIMLPGFVESGYVAPLDELKDQYDEFVDLNDLVPRYLETNRVNDTLYGLPVFGESTFLMYRKDLFEEYGIKVPETFDEIEAAAQAIEDNTDGEITGITMRGQQGIQGVYVWASYLWGMGGSFLTEDGQSALDSPEAVSALEAFAKVLNDYGPVGVANMGWEENRLLFQQGKAGMTLDATVNGAFNEDPDVSTVVGKVGYAPVPMQAENPVGGSSSLGAFGLFVAEDSQQKEAAWLFVSWATSAEAQIKSLELDPNSGVTSLSAMESEAFSSRYGAFKDAMLESIARGNPQYLPTVPQANEIINNAGIAVSQVLAGTASAQDALMAAHEANNAALSE